MDCGEAGVWQLTIRNRYHYYAKGNHKKFIFLRQCFKPQGGIAQPLADDLTFKTTDEALLILRAGLHTKLQANGWTLKNIVSGHQDQREIPTMKIYTTRQTYRLTRQ